MDIALLHIVLWAPLVGALLTMLFGQGHARRAWSPCSRRASRWRPRPGCTLRYDLQPAAPSSRAWRRSSRRSARTLRIGVDGVSLPLVFLNRFLMLPGGADLLEVRAPAAALLRAGAVPPDGGDGRLRLAGPVRLLPLLGAGAGPDVPADRDLGRRAPRVRGDEVHHLHDRRQRLHAGRHPGALLHDRRRHVRPVPDQRRRQGAAGRPRRCCCSCCCSSGSRSRCRSSRSTPGCRTPTSRRRRRSACCWRACCSRWAATG